MRFKPPPSSQSEIGWRVEFRSMDIQLTDFENASLIVLLGMINNIINHFDLDFIMPLSKIDENMERAHMRDAASTQKFWFKINILPTGKCYRYNLLEQSDYLLSNKFGQGEGCPETVKQGCTYDEKNHYVVEELYLWEVLAGKPEIKFKGIYPLIEDYLVDSKYGQSVVDRIHVCLNFLMARARGEIKTGARLMRDFVDEHPKYKHDSDVNNRVAFDLVKSIIHYSEEQNKLLSTSCETLGAATGKLTEALNVPLAMPDCRVAAMVKASPIASPPKLC
jgi:glutamate--cysteine ligase catalytic subunit